jgi:hypothetical protein
VSLPAAVNAVALDPTVLPRVARNRGDGGGAVSTVSGEEREGVWVVVKGLSGSGEAQVLVGRGDDVQLGGEYEINKLIN